MEWTLGTIHSAYCQSALRAQAGHSSLPANSLHWKVEKSESNDIEALHLEKPKFSDKCRSKNLIPGKPKMKLSDKDIVQGGEWSSLSP